ncbi:phototropic-responsive NPH3 family protein [Tasmannia lanceolata]|uniref:phototropic-responsive NPH3 family protein n=1 Tax=Tasmannia lanceolata TaxID=3420 RepID=UPI004064BD68
MKGRMDLGVVETIYEEDHDEDSNSSPLTPTLTPICFHSSLQTRVNSWIEATGFKPDVFLLVHGRCFHLHKDPLISRSTYLKRYLTVTPEITVILPSKITAETFATVASFCYGSDIVITPFNVASLRIAAELLDMTEENGIGDENLQRKTETFFRQAVAVNREYAAIVLCSCLALLPEAEETAFLASRCIEALVLTEGFDGVSKDSWVDGVASLTVEEFQMIAESMKERFIRNHDVLYKIVDLYLMHHHTGTLTEEQKSKICFTVDCNKLSQHLLIHAVQNPKMPLRFVIQAMLIEQLNTRRSVFSVASADRAGHSVTLGNILQRDAALRHMTQLKESMEATSTKIKSLESDVVGMKKRLKESEALDGLRSESFRFSSEISGKSCKGNSKSKKSFGRILANGLKNVFRMSLSSKKPTSENRGLEGRDGGEGDGDGDGDGDVFVEHRRGRSHRRSNSFA